MKILYVVTLFPFQFVNGINNTQVQTPSLWQRIKSKWMMKLDCALCSVEPYEWDNVALNSTFQDWMRMLKDPFEAQAALLHFDNVISSSSLTKSVRSFQTQICQRDTTVSTLAVSLCQSHNSEMEQCQICFDANVAQSPLSCEKHFACSLCTMKIHDEFSFQCPFCRFTPIAIEKYFCTLPLESQFLLIRKRIARLLDTLWVREERHLNLQQLLNSPIDRHFIGTSGLSALHGSLLKWYVDQPMTMMLAYEVRPYLQPQVLTFLLSNLIIWLKWIRSLSKDDVTASALLSWCQHWTPIHNGVKWRQKYSSSITNASPLRPRLVTAAHQLKTRDGDVDVYVRYFVLLHQVSIEFENLVTEIDSFVQSIATIAHSI